MKPRDAKDEVSIMEDSHPGKSRAAGVERTSEQGMGV